jgi:hypothetical protein
MPRQNLSPEDLAREVRAIFALHDDAKDAHAFFCDDKRGMHMCCRHKGHNGKHAVGTAHEILERQGFRSWYATRVVRW